MPKLRDQELKNLLQAGGKASPFWIVGPCVLEDDKTVVSILETLVEIQNAHQIPIVFKASFDKANRTSVHSHRGPGIEEGLLRLSELKKSYSLPFLTDIHEPAQARMAAEVVDILQIPAFMCRQTDLLKAAAETSCAVNIKKGQFMAPDQVKTIVEKVNYFGKKATWITERGVSFGYHRLIVDFAGFVTMESQGADLIFDCTHSVQLPGALGEATGGQRDAIPSLARAAAAVGVKGFFAETHPQPERAWSDAANAWPLERLEELILGTNEIALVAHR